jgi:type I protein arginine methyltransferase
MSSVRLISATAGNHELAVRTVPAHDQPFALFPSIGEYAVYDDGVYNGFDAPDQRLRAYRDAISASVPGQVALDIGTGRDALWAVAAARAGARHVFAVEQQPEAAGQSRRAVAKAGLADRITVIQGRSTDVALPEPAQVCISEIVGNIASAEGIIIALADARRRLCTADCVWIPFRVQTWVAAIDLSPALAAPDYALAAESLPYLEQIFTSVGHPFDLRLCLGGPVDKLRISSAAAVESIVFDHRHDVPPAGSLSTADLTVEANRARMTGLLLWARVAVTAHSAELDTLTSDTRGWAPVYVPLSLDGIPVKQGEHLNVTFRRTTSDDNLHPDYRLTVESAGTAELGPMTWSSRRHGRDFRRSPLYRHLFPPAGHR